MINGRVLVSGDPLPGVTLYFTPDLSTFRRFADASHRIGYATTDSSGAYSIQLISGMYDVDIRPPLGRGLLGRTEQVHVVADHSRLDFKFEGYHVKGRVLTSSGGAVDSGLVSAFFNPPGRGQAASLIEQGNYSLLLPGGRYSLDARAANYWSGFGPQQQESVWISADTTIDFRLEGISVSGQVLGPDGRPMKDVSVEAEADRPGHRPRGIALIKNMTTADGRYQLYVPPGSYSLWFRPPYPFYIVPRIVGPVTISEPVSIGANLSGVEWKGTLRRIGTSDPVQDAIVIARITSETTYRGAAIGVDQHGGFEFILEPGLRYDLEIADQARHEKEVIPDILAQADTTFEILLSPLITTSRADSTVKLSIRSVAGEEVHGRKRRWPPDWIDATLLNTDRDTVTLALPGDKSFWGGRTPLMDWDIRGTDGQRLERLAVLTCGNINPLRAEEVFRLAPGQQRTFRTGVPDYYRYLKGSHRYQFRLSYENRPHLNWGGGALGPHDPDAFRLLRQSTPCKLVSNTLELEVKEP